MTTPQQLIHFTAICLLVMIVCGGADAWGQQNGGYPQYDPATDMTQPGRLNPARRLVPTQSQNRDRGQTSLPRVRIAQGAVPQRVPPGQPRNGYGPMMNDPMAFSVRIKDVTTIEGHRANRLTGIGLVSGLAGTGGKSVLTQNLGRSMARNLDIVTDIFPTGSTATVSVSVEIPAFARVGETVSATVSLLGDATSLRGGLLESTPLKGYDGQVYAVAGGSLLLGGYSAEGAGASVAKNHVTAAKVQATIEFPIYDGPAFPGAGFRLLLKNKDYATAYRMATEINKYFPGHARAADQGSVYVHFPQAYRNSKIDFVVLINEFRVTPDAPARVVIDQKSGTIVIGQNVRLSKIMFAKDNLIVTTTESPIVSQPAPFAGGETVVVPRTRIGVTETGGRYNMINQQTTVGELAAALNTLGVTPQDLIAVFRSIESSGALQAQLIVE